MLARMLESMGHEVQEAPNGTGCLERIEERGYGLLITDIVMPEKGGLRTIEDVRRQFPALKILAISGGGTLLNSTDYLSLAESLGAHGILEKPFGRDELEAAVEKLVETGAA